MTKRLVLALMLSVALGCGGSQSDGADAGGDSGETKPAEVVKEADYATVQHILIGFRGSVRGKNIARTRAEAQVLAKEVYKRAQSGEDFDALVKQYTDDAYPGIYHMANHGFEGSMAKRIFSRGQMVAAFGDVGFPLKIGQVGVAAHDPVKSPYGWHIIKRLELGVEP